MAEIKDSRGRATLEHLQQQSEQQRDEAQLRHVLHRIEQKRAELTQLRNLQVKALSPALFQQLARLVGAQLRGQLPPGLAEQLARGKVDAEILQRLLGRLTNAGHQASVGKAQTPNAARALATDKSLPQHALHWAKFIEKAAHIPAAGTLRGRAGSAAAKGEGSTLVELLAGASAAKAAPGLRHPSALAPQTQLSSPTQKPGSMRVLFGARMAAALEQLGVSEPLQFLQTGASPEGRSMLARQLNVPRARLLGMLMHAELLKIGPGNKGELGIAPELLRPLKSCGIAMLASLAALRGLSQTQLAQLYKKLRVVTGGFRNTAPTGRPPVKRDLLHWAKAAARTQSDILLRGDLASRERGLHRDDAQEIIQTWYYESLPWRELQELQRRELHQTAAQWEHEPPEERHGERRQQHREGEDEEEQRWEDWLPELAYDENRGDHLMCFWIQDVNPDPSSAGGSRRMYVCIDPSNGAIIPQHIEVESGGEPT